ncbi:Peptidase S10, serine carboxypeptidase, partial [Cynara cardunculus var. scolymus]
MVLLANISDSVSTADSRILEKQLRLLVLGHSGASMHDLSYLTGYVRIKHIVGARMFYYFFESRNRKDDPSVIWLTGGPGWSSAVALFNDNGPFHLTNNLSLVWTDNSWDKEFFKVHPDYVTNDLYITGESYGGHYITAFAA